MEPFDQRQGLVFTMRIVWQVPFSFWIAKMVLLPGSYSIYNFQLNPSMSQYPISLLPTWWSLFQWLNSTHRPCSPNHHHTFRLRFSSRTLLACSCTLAPCGKCQKLDLNWKWKQMHNYCTSSLKFLFIVVRKEKQSHQKRNWEQIYVNSLPNGYSDAESACSLNHKCIKYKIVGKDGSCKTSSKMDLPNAYD